MIALPLALSSGIKMKITIMYSALMAKVATVSGYRENGQWCELRNSCNDGDATSNWETDAAINLIGETNYLRLTVSGNQIIAYVNDEMLFMMEDSTFSSGGVGIYMATTRFGEGEVVINSYSTGEISSGSDSMTDDTDSMTDE